MKPRKAILITLICSLCFLFGCKHEYVEDPADRYRGYWECSRLEMDGNVYDEFFVDDSGRDSSDQAPWELGKLGCHEVGRGDRTDDAGIIIRSFIAHAADGAHVGEGCEVLVRISVETGLCHLLAEDRIGILYETNLLGSDFTNDTDRKTRTRERLTENKVLRYT